jgi:hypothetical protein
MGKGEIPPVKHQLLALFPKVLPKSPAAAVTGTELIQRLREAGLKGSTEKSLRSWFSGFANDPGSPIARVAHGNGYYLRELFDRSVEADDSVPSADSSARDQQLEEKFRALYMKWCEGKGQFPVLLNHNEGARRAAGLNRWKYPDVISVKWEVLHPDNREMFDENAFDVMRGLGEPPFEIISAELKVELTSATVRPAFFQCVSNSRWAHEAQLVVASISDDKIVAELRRLGPSYHINVLTFGLSPDALQRLPNADKIRGMTTADVDGLLRDVSVNEIAASTSDEQIDWDQLRDLQNQHDSIDDILEWIGRCLKDKQPHSFETWARNLKKNRFSS